MKKIVISLLMLFSLLFIFASCGNSTESSEDIENNEIIKLESVISEQVEEPTESETLQEYLEENTPYEKESPDEELTVEEQAVEDAKWFIQYKSLSRSALITELKNDGYSEDDAIYGADHCGADWNEQALSKAKEYLNITSYSYDKLIKQLQDFGFSLDEATYAVDNCGAEWNEQCAELAEQYMKSATFTYEDLVEQLEWEGYTTEQAEYGAEQAGALKEDEEPNEGEEESTEEAEKTENTDE